jgi:hypothetical protein
MFWYSWFLLFLLRLPSLFEPYWYGDEGVYLSLGQGINRGLTLYSQIHDNKPPLLYYLAAISSSLPAGWQVFGFRLLLLLWMIPTVYIFYLLSQKFLSKSLSRYSVLVFIILSSIPLIEGNIANAEIFMLLPTLTAFLLFYNSSLSIKKMLYSGLLLGLAFTFKVPVAIEFFFLLCWLVFIIDKFNLGNIFKLKIKNYFVFVLAFFLPILLFYLYFVLKGVGPQFLFAALLQNFGYLGSWVTGSHSASATSGGIIWRFGLLLLAWIILYIFFKRKILDKKLFFLSSWFGAALFGVLLSSRPYPHYFIQLLPPFLLVLFSVRRNFYLSIFILVFLGISIVKYKFYFYRTFPYYLNFVKYIFKIEPLSQYRQYFGANINDIYQLSDVIKSKTAPGDSIFIWGDEPYLYPLASRLPSTKYVVAYHVLDFNGYDLVMQQLSTKFPQAIIYDPSMNRSFPKLDLFLKDYYFLDDQIGPYYLFLPRQ